MARLFTVSEEKSLEDYLVGLTLGDKAEIESDVTEVVSRICSDVFISGDKAILNYTNKFDRTEYSDASELKVTQDEIDAAYASVSKEVIASLEKAAKRIMSYHEKQMPVDLDYKDEEGVRLGNMWRAIEHVGLYVPGGLASYPSSVFMNAIPAKVAGVKKMVMVVPAPEGNLNPIVLAAAKIVGITEIYKVGGAQAVAALALGTKTIPKVMKIVGPGNAYVAYAKRAVSSWVGIDMIAGPSEILIVADDKNDPDWIAADLLSQAEHDENARSILITQSKEFADKVIQSVEKTLSGLERESIARKSWENNGAIIVADGDFENEAINIINIIAAEHLELAVEDEVADRMLGNITNAGAVFMGRYTPEAIGDYMAGPSHVLPTSGTARFSSGLSVYDFLKRMSVIGCDRKSFANLAESTELLANEEGLGAHALSIKIRRGNDI